MEHPGSSMVFILFEMVKPLQRKHEATRRSPRSLFMPRIKLGFLGWLLGIALTSGRGDAAFAQSRNDAEARAAFTEAFKVFSHPRCVNCHPAGDAPLQGEDSRPHESIRLRR